jgi:glycerol-3-phosphate dehydrogenase
VGGVFVDLLTDKVYRVRAKYVINCTGVWADKIRLLDDPAAKKRIIAVGGSHIVYDAGLVSGKYGITAPTSDGRIILVQPWLGKALAGTTEKTFSEPTNNPVCSP